MSEPKKTIIINPDFLKLPMKGNRTRKEAPKPIKIRSDKPATSNDKTIKRRALNYIRKRQEDKYKQLIKGSDTAPHTKTYTDEFKSDFDDSLEFLQKLSDQNMQKEQVKNATIRQYPVVPNSTLFTAPVFNQILDHSPLILRSGIDQNVSLEEVDAFKNLTNLVPSIPQTNFMTTNLPPIHLPKPAYGCLKGGNLPTYRTLKNQHLQNNHLTTTPANQFPQTHPTPSPKNYIARLTPEQQRAELKQYLEKRKEEKERVNMVKRQRNILKPHKKQKRTTTRTFRVGKSKHYAKIGVLIPNKTIRTQVLAKKQKIRETPVQDMRKYLIKKGLIRVGSSCPNDVLRQMYESSMMMCGEIQNHNADNLLYNYLHNGI